LKKQAQQPTSDTASGLRPPDVYSLSSCTKKREDCSKKLDVTDSGSIVSASGHRPGNTCVPKAVVRVHQPHSAPCEICPLPTASLIHHIKAADSNTRTDSKRSHLNEGVTQISGTSRSHLLSPSALSPLTLVFVGNSVGLSSGVVTSGPSSNAPHRAVILSQHKAHLTSPPTHKKQHVSSSLVSPVSMPVHDHPGTLSYPHCPQEIPIQALITPPVPALMSAYERMDVEVTPAQHIAEKQKGSLAKVPQGAHMCFKFLPGTRLIVSSRLCYRVQCPMLSQPCVFLRLSRGLACHDPHINV
jgi:hypothetical protein